MNTPACNIAGPLMLTLKDQQFPTLVLDFVYLWVHHLGFTLSKLRRISSKHSAFRRRSSQERGGLDLLRHSACHRCLQAVIYARKHLRPLSHSQVPNHLLNSMCIRTCGKGHGSDTCGLTWSMALHPDTELSSAMSSTKKRASAKASCHKLETPRDPTSPLKKTQQLI